MPALRGFRAALLDDASDLWPTGLAPDAPRPLADAEALTARRLAADGLLSTAAQVIEILGPARYVAPDATALATLRESGLPVDLLEHFRVGDGPREPARVVSWIAARLGQGRTAAALRSELAALPFDFVKTRNDFAVASESGDEPVAWLRLQLPRGAYWRGPGDGGAVDIARQLAEGLREVPLLVSLADEHVDAFVALAAAWPHDREGRLVVVAEPLAVSQWTQDDGKAGLVGGSGQDGGRRAATLVPRYACRRNDASEFVPGDSYLADGLAASGHPVFQSPLIFQGGNLLAVTDPRGGERILLVSEAEIHRNVALGLTEAQVLRAFALELGVDRCVVVPLVSFHLDYDVTVRAHDGRLVAFVNDVDAASRTVLQLGLASLERADALDAAVHRAALEHLRARRDLEFVQLVAPRVSRLAADRGSYPLSVAEHFAADAMDSGVGNLQRFLTALELQVASALPETQWPAEPLARSYLESLRRSAAEHRELAGLLGAVGWQVVPIPSLAAAEQSLTYLNGIQARDRYVMPAYGGLFAPLDDAAEAAFRRVLGPDLAILRVRSGESQRRAGAVHCAVAAYPRP
jgi:hypothetical protein